MFNWVVKYFGLLKHVPVLPQLFDSLMKIGTLFYNRKLLDYMDDIENEVLSWPNTTIQVHKFGGTQFNFQTKELGHIHGNGLLDVLFSRKMKSELTKQYKVQDHHIFKNSGWISFQIKTEADKLIAITLLRHSHKACCENLNTPK